MSFLIVVTFLMAVLTVASLSCVDLLCERPQEPVIGWSSLPSSTERESAGVISPSSSVPKLPLPIIVGTSHPIGRQVIDIGLVNSAWSDTTTIGAISTMTWSLDVFGRASRNDHCPNCGGALAYGNPYSGRLRLAIVFGEPFFDGCVWCLKVQLEKAGIK